MKMEEDIVISSEDILHFIPTDVAHEDIVQRVGESLPEYVEQMKLLLGFDGNELIHNDEFRNLILQTIILQTAYEVVSGVSAFKMHAEQLRQQKSIKRDILLCKLLFTDWHDSRARINIVDKLMWNPTVLRQYSSKYDKNSVLYDEEFQHFLPLISEAEKEAEQFVSPELMEPLVQEVDRYLPEIHQQLVHMLREYIAARLAKQFQDVSDKKTEIIDYMLEHIDTPCLLYYKRSDTYRNSFKK